MTTAIIPLSYTDTLVNGKEPVKADLISIFNEFQTYSNNSLANNLVQLAKDSWGDAASFTNNGVRQFTYDLYNKLAIENNRTAGDYTISTTGSWEDLDASNVQITVVPDLVGNFKATFQFTVELVTTNSVNECNVRFRLTDGSEVSVSLPRVHTVTGVNASTYTFPITLTHQFDTWSAASKTVRLQYNILTLTATTLKVLANTNDPIYMQVEKI